MLRLPRQTCVDLMVWLQWKNAGKWDNAKLSEKLKNAKEVLPTGGSVPNEPDLAKALQDVIAEIDSGKPAFEVYDAEGDASSPKAEPAAQGAAQAAGASSSDAPAFPGDDGRTTTTGAAETAKEKKPRMTEAEREAERKAKLAAKEKERADKLAAKEKERADKIAAKLAEREAAKAAKAAGRPPKEKTAKAKREGGPASVRLVLTREACAAQILKKYDLKLGVTDEMIKEVDDTYGEKNWTRSMSSTIRAWHTLNAYFGVYPHEERKVSTRPEKTKGEAAAEPVAAEAEAAQAAAV